MSDMEKNEMENSDFKMNGFKKDDDMLRRKYDEVMDSIADDIKQINFDETDALLNSIDVKSEDDTAPLFDDIVFEGEFGGDQSEETELDLKLSEDDEDELPDLMSCEECRELLYDYVSDITYENENKAIETHLKNCEMCRLELDDIRDMISVMRSSQAPMPPSNLVPGIHESLIKVAEDVKAENSALRAENVKTVLQKAKNVFASIRARFDYFIKHANWKIVAPAALSAVLVIGVASSGLYQVMKSSDEIYNFSDNVAISEPSATAKPSASGLDEYVDGKKKASSSPKSSALPKASTKPGSTSASASPRASTKPSTSTGLPSIGSGTGSTSKGTTSSSGSSSTRSSSTSSSSTNKNTSSSSSKNTTSKSSTSSPTKTPTPTAKPYVMPNIILPDISSLMNTPAPEPEQEPRITLPAVEAEPTAAAPDYITGGAGGGGAAAQSEAPVDTPAPAATPAPAKTPTPTAAKTPVPSASSKPTASSKPSASSVSGKNLFDTLSPEADRVRNENGETEIYAEKAAQMDDASVICCAVKDEELYNKILNSAFADCSKIEENGDIVLYLTADEFVEYSKILRDNKVDYTLSVLGKNDDVKVIISGSKSK